MTLDVVSMPCVVGGAGKGLLAGHVSDPARGEPLEGGHDRVTQGDLAHLLSCQLHPSVYNTLDTQFITSLLQSACVLSEMT